MAITLHADSSPSHVASSLDSSKSGTSQTCTPDETPQTSNCSRFSESLPRSCPKSYSSALDTRCAERISQDDVDQYLQMDTDQASREGTDHLCSEGTDQPPHEPAGDIFYDMPLIRTALDEILQVGQDGNHAFQNQFFQQATRFYHTSLSRLKEVDHINCNGLCKYSMELDATVTSIAFTTLINSAAAFLQFGAADCSECKLACQYTIALSCADQAAAAATRNCLQHPGHCWTPSNYDKARMHKVKAVAYQKLGHQRKTLDAARQVLVFEPRDEGCKMFVSKMNAAPLDAAVLCDKLERLLLQSTHADEDKVRADNQKA